MKSNYLSFEISTFGHMGKYHRNPPSWSSLSGKGSFSNSEDFAVELSIAEAVDTMRLHRNWSQAKLAKEIGTSQSAIARLESGWETPSIKLLKRVAQAFGHVLTVSFQEPMPF